MKPSGKAKSYNSLFQGRGASTRTLLLGASLYVLATGALSISGIEAHANPSGGVVVSGSATITTNGNTVTIHQDSARAVIDWNDFSVGTGELTEFLQGSSNAAILNRVISSIPSSILGQIRADGNVYLVNPNGIVVGQGAQINANSFIASALNLSAEQFMIGEDLAFSGNSAAGVVNLGEINAGQGDVYLIARQVTNKGTIRASQGEVGLAAGTEVFLSADRGNTGSRITVKVNDNLREALRSGAAVSNEGLIEAARAVLAASGNDLYDMAIKNSGTIRVTGVSKNSDGTISLSAGKTGSSRIESSGALIATNQDGTGGSVNVLGDHITLKSGSSIDVSAPKGKGSVMVGGDYKGGNGVQTAKTVTVEQGARIDASATNVGDGGRIIVWSDENTIVAGTLSAKGGLNGGDGGFIETSAKQDLQIEEESIIEISASNPWGRGGEWYLDPSDITISDGGGTVSTSTINSVLNAGGDVVIETNAAASGSGTITLNNATINKTSGDDSTLTLRAHTNISMTNSTIGATGSGELSVLFNAAASGDGDGAIYLSAAHITSNGGDVVFGGGLTTTLDTDGNGILGDGGTGLDFMATEGNASFNPGITMTSSSSIQTGAGDIIMNGRGYSSSAASELDGILINGSSTLTTTSGTIRLTGSAGDGVGGSDGIAVQVNSSLTTQSGDIVLTGYGGVGSGSSNRGILLYSNALITSATGDITLYGEGASTGAAGSNYNSGIELSGATVSSTGSGNLAGSITFTGIAGDGEDANHGMVFSSSTLVTSVDGDITLNGTGGSNNSVLSTDNNGVFIANGVLIQSTGMTSNAAKITLNGVGGNGDDTNHGVLVHGAGYGTYAISSAYGDITLTGNGGSNGIAGSHFNSGIILYRAGIESTGVGDDAARITLTGIGGHGEDYNRGILIEDTSSILSIDGDINITGSGGANGLADSNNNNGIHIYLANRIRSLGATSNAAKINITGTGGAGIRANQGVFMEVGAISDPIISSGYGDITIVGQGGGDGTGIGNNGYHNYGGDIESTGVGVNAAKITITGTGGAGTSNNGGIYFYHNTENARILTVDGDVALTGTGGYGSTDYNYGLWAGNNSLIQSTGTGRISLTGTGGGGTRGDGMGINYGVYLNQSRILSGYGDITMTGTGGSDGTGTANHGVLSLYSEVTSTGTGDDAADIFINGTGGAGLDSNHGVNLTSSSVITTIDGDIRIVGQGGSNASTTSDFNRGVSITGLSYLRSTGTGANAGNITLVGTGGAGQTYGLGISLEASGSAFNVIETVDGDISLTGTGMSNRATGSNGNYGVFINNGGRVTSTGTGNEAGNITLLGYGGLGDSDNQGFRITTSSSGLMTVDGDIRITVYGGSNGGTGDTNVGINTSGIIQSTGTGSSAGTITLIGYGGLGDDFNHGIVLNTSSVTTSAYGDISLYGYGGTSGTAGSAYNYGISNGSTATVSSTGTGTNAADIYIFGQGASGSGSLDQASGVIWVGGLQSVDGDIRLDAYGASSNSASQDQSLFVQGTSAVIRSTGDGDITLFGSAAAAIAQMRGVFLSSGTIETNLGDIFIQGIGTSSAFDIGTWDTINPTIRSIGGGEITFHGASRGLNFSAPSATTGIIGGAGTSKITFIADSFSFSNNITPTIQATGDIIFKPHTASRNISLGSATGSLTLSSTFLGYLNAGGRVILGDQINGTGVVTATGLDLSGRKYDVYGGSIIASGFSNINGSNSTFTARTGDLLLKDNDIFGGSSMILDEIKSNFRTLAGDLILAPVTAADSIGINGGSGTRTLTAADLSGFAQIGRSLMIGDPTASTGTTGLITINSGGSSLDLSGLSYGIGFNGGTITTEGAITSARDLTFAADSFNWGAYNYSAQRDIIVKPQTATLDIGVSGGSGTLNLSDADLARLFPALSGTGTLVLGESNGGSGIIAIDGWDVSSSVYDVALYSGQLSLLNNADVSVGGDLLVIADTISAGSSLLRAKGGIDLRHRTAGRTIQVDESTGKLQYNYVDQINLANLDYDSDDSGDEQLTIGSGNSGDVTWTTTSADLGEYSFRTGGNLSVVNSNTGASYGVGDGTSGDIHWTDAELADLEIGNSLIFGDSAAGMGAVQISNQNLGYGLNASGGSISMGSWNAGTKNVTLTARTGGITTNGGTIVGNILTISSSAATTGTFNTDINTLNYTVGGALNVREVNALTISGGVATGAGTVDIRTANGSVTIANGLTMRGDTLIEAGGVDTNLTNSGVLTNHATTASGLTLRAAGNISLNSGSHITNSTSQELNVTLNADRDQNNAGYIRIDGSNIYTNGGDFIAGGGLSPDTEMAWGVSDQTRGLYIYGATDISTGSGDIIMNGHGYEGVLTQATNIWRDGIWIEPSSASGPLNLRTTSGDIRLTGVAGQKGERSRGLRLGGGSNSLYIGTITGDINLVGTGGGNGQQGSYANHGIYITGSNALIESTGIGASVGAVTLNGTAGNGEDSNYGVYVEGSSIRSVDADITLHGIGASNGQKDSRYNYGVAVNGAGSIRSTGTGDNAGNVSITGVSGAGEDYNDGVLIAQTGGLISVVDGDLLITGTAESNGQRGAAVNRGITIEVGSVIQSTGTGSNAGQISLYGMGGAGEDSNFGIMLSASTLSSIDGDIRIEGTGRTQGIQGSVANTGIQIQNGSIVRSTGTGSDAANITMRGVGGDGEDLNYGISIAGSGTAVTTVMGDIDIIGRAGSNRQHDTVANVGASVSSSAQVLSSGMGPNAGDITITGYGGAGSRQGHGAETTGSALIRSVDGDIAITGYSGSSDKQNTSFNHGLYLNNASILSTGTTSYTGNVTLTGVATGRSSNNYGISVESMVISGVAADLFLNGTGAQARIKDSLYMFGINIGSTSTITSSGTGALAGNITIRGQGGRGEDANLGVNMDQTASISTIDGDIDIEGTGGGVLMRGAATNRGFTMSTTSSIVSTGIGDDAGNISILGVSGFGHTDNVGMIVAAGTLISSVDGDIGLTGIGRYSPFRTSVGYGAQIQSTVRTTGTGNNAGNITVNGTGYGMRGSGYINGASTTFINTVDGDISISGQFIGNGWKSTANDRRGVQDSSGTVTESTGSGNITYYGIGSDYGLNREGLYLGASSVLRTNTGDISLTGEAREIDGVYISSPVTLTTTGPDADLDIISDLVNIGSAITVGGDITLNTLTQERGISLGTDVANTLNLSSSELASLNPLGTLTIGNNQTGVMRISSGVNLYAGTFDTVLNASSIEMDNGLSARGDLTLNTDALEISAGSLSVPGDLIVSPRSVSNTIGLGGAAGTLNLTDAEIARLSVTGLLRIGRVDGTGSFGIESADFQGRSGSMELYGGAMTLQDDLSTSGSVLMAANAGNMTLNGTVSGSGSGRTVTLAALQGNVRSGVGASFVDAGTGSFVVYTGSWLNSLVGGLNMDPNVGSLYNMMYAEYAGLGSKIVYREGTTDFAPQMLGSNFASEFLGSFVNAITKIFGSTRAQQGGFTGSLLTVPEPLPINYTALNGIGIAEASDCSLSPDMNATTLSCSSSVH